MSGFITAAGSAVVDAAPFVGGGAGGGLYLVWLSKQLDTIKTELSAIGQRQHKTEVSLARIETRSCALSADVKELQQLLPRQVPTIKR